MLLACDLWKNLGCCMSYWGLNQTSALSSRFARSLKSSFSWWRVTCWCLAMG